MTLIVWKGVHWTDWVLGIRVAKGARECRWAAVLFIGPWEFGVAIP